MPSRKRASADMEAAPVPAQPSLLTRLRNMWEFANIMQFIFLFGRVVKVDNDFDINVSAPTSAASPHAPTFLLSTHTRWTRHWTYL